MQTQKTPWNVPRRFLAWAANQKTPWLGVHGVVYHQVTGTRV
jgi:hypothetical protein